MSYAIETNQLSFAYHHQPILNDVDLQIPTGSIYGYLGKNGSGKTTTIKLLIGLLNPMKEKSVFINGQEFNAHREESLSLIGSLIESPAFYGHLSGWENMKYLDLVYKCGSKRIQQVLEETGLWGAKDKKVKKYSTGMKQRLGIAMAIFHNPEILILDEPLNGLDPEAVHVIRELLLKLKDAGKTILLSSHILSEIEKVCTHVGILEQGNLLYQGGLNELMRSIQREIIIRTDDARIASEVCEAHGYWTAIKSNQELCVRVSDDKEYDQLISILVHKNIAIYDITSNSNSLETIFLNLTNKS